MKPQRQPSSVTSVAPKRINVLGATGSIGDSALAIIAEHPTRFCIEALTAQNNAEKLIALAERYQPRLVAIGNEAHYATVKAGLSARGIKVTAGKEGLLEAASSPADLTISAMVGLAGLLPTLHAIKHSKAVAVANKETLVSAGTLVLDAYRTHGTMLLPIDSEHNAIFQVFAETQRAEVEKITLTASGGPFRNRPLETLARATSEEALAHPRWNMGPKVSIDSATMMNKSLELIEAHYLFAMPPQKLAVLIHPESIVHSLVHYADGSVLAQLGMPDMRIPIAYALSWPERMSATTPRLDLATIGALHFEAPDIQRFPALKLGYDALRAGPSLMIALNAANEVAVSQFLAGAITFPAITQTVETVMAKANNAPILSLEDVLEADRAARTLAAQCATA